MVEVNLKVLLITGPRKLFALFTFKIVFYHLESLKLKVSQQSKMDWFVIKAPQYCCLGFGLKLGHEEKATYEESIQGAWLWFIRNLIYVITCTV